MKDVLITVIIPTYNRQDQLVKTINSVLNQSYQHLEVIICDDGSTDNTKAVVNKIKDERVRYLALPHSGLPAIARNAGIRIAHGEWIAFLDSDDMWLPEKLVRQFVYLQKNNLQICCTNASAVGDSHKKKMHEYGHHLLSYPDLALNNLIIASSVLVKKSLLNQVGYFPVNPGYRAFEDYVLWMRMSTICDIGVLDEPLTIYHDQQKVSIRHNLTYNDQVLKRLRTDIILWGIKVFLKHPNRLRLVSSMWQAKKYLRSQI